MATKLYVGNLSFQTTDQTLAKLFGETGTVASAQVITDRETGQARGFGFVEMATEDEAQQAIAAINGRSVEGRTLVVNASKPREGGGGSRSNGGDSRNGGNFGGSPRDSGNFSGTGSNGTGSNNRY